MIFKPFFIEDVLMAIAKKLKKPYQDFIPITHNLIQNFYEDQESFQSIKFQELVNINVPVRIAKEIVLYCQEYQNTKAQRQIKKIEQNKIKISQIIREKQQKYQQKVDLNSKILFQQMNSSYSKDIRAQIQIVQTLMKILKNIYDYPDQSKYRQFKKQNKTINRIICNNPFCLKYFKSLGFEQEEQFIYLLTPDLKQISIAIQNLQNFILKKDVNKMEIEISSSSLTSSQSQIKAKQSQGQILKILQQLKQFIDNAQKAPLKDRKINLYMKQSEKKYTNQYKLPPKATNQTHFNEIPQQLLNKWIRIMSIPHPRVNQFSYFLGTQIHQQTLIKVVLPNQEVIQSYYRIKEPLQNVLDTIQKFAIGDLYLYQTPPKKIFKNLKMSLQDLECVPFATIYVGSDYQIHMERTNNFKR